MKLSETDIRGIYRKWRYGAGPFRCFFRASNFISLKHYPDFILDEPVSEMADLRSVQDGKDESASAGIADLVKSVLSVVEKYDRTTTLFFIDLPGTESIITAYFLRKILKIKPVPVFGNPLHPFGLIGGKKYISALLGYGKLLDNTEGQGYAFIMDWNRYGDYSDDDYKKFFNNQYELIDEDLPSVEMLKELGYNKVVAVCVNNMKEDCEAYLKYLEEQNFPVERESLRKD
ncbi:MAG: hypothetical protein LWY06_09990 [Firmicutes bacterium]|nr:hypothetical protein [Bacillota bacterium]